MAFLRGAGAEALARATVQVLGDTVAIAMIAQQSWGCTSLRGSRRSKSRPSRQGRQQTRARLFAGTTTATLGPPSPVVRRAAGLEQHLGGSLGREEARDARPLPNDIAS